VVKRPRRRKLQLRLIHAWRRIRDPVTLSDASSSVIPPLSVVKIVKVTTDEPAWNSYEGRIFRIGYYRKNDGLDCVWLVDDQGSYSETIDQEMVRTHCEVLERSDEADLYGVDRPIIGPRIEVRRS
jgi:hypothetical protein